MQLVLGVSGGLLIYSGLKDIDIIKFFSALVKKPSEAFSTSYFYQKPAAPGTTPSSNTTPTTPTATPDPNQWKSV